MLLVALGLGYLTMAGLGVLVGLGSRSIFTSFLFSLVLALVSWVGGGGLGPLFVFGPAAVHLARFNPGAHLNDLARWAYWGGQTNPGHALLALGVMAAASTLLAVAVGSRRLRSQSVTN